MAAVEDQQILDALLREDLGAFIEKAFRTVSAGDPYVHNWHIEAIAHQLAEIEAGENDRLIITQPPRSLKSICSSVAFVAWALGRNPALRFICVSYSKELARDLAAQFRRVVTSDWYRRIFPKVTLTHDRETECVTTAGGGRIAASIGGTLTGRGADIIIIDDPLKAEDAQSEAARRWVIDWYTGTLTTRLNDKEKGAIVLVMQRLHEEDLAGHLEQAGFWRRLDLPAIALEDERIEVGAHRFHERKEGEALQGTREPLPVLEKIRRDLGSLKFSAQYQQRPIPAEGNLVKRAWFAAYDRAPQETARRIIQSWDIATSTREAADYSACVTLMVHAGNYYVLDVWRGRKSYPDLKKFMVAHARRFGANAVLIEKAGPGDHMLQEFRRSRPQGFPLPIGIPPVSQKDVRMEAASDVIESGAVHLPEAAPWLHAFLHELLAFPNGRHDDQVDAFSQAINWQKKKNDMKARGVDPMPGFGPKLFEG